MDRNCPRYFPDDVKPPVELWSGRTRRAKPPWHPVYPDDKHPYGIEDILCDECPVSYCTPKSNELVRIFAKADLIGRDGAASLYGPDLSKWPTWAFDAQAIVNMEDRRIENARMKELNRGN